MVDEEVPILCLNTSQVRELPGPQEATLVFAQLRLVIMHHAHIKQFQVMTVGCVCACAQLQRTQDDPQARFLEGVTNAEVIYNGDSNSVF